MPPPLRVPEASPINPPRFYLTTREPIRPVAILLATIAAAAALYSILFALSHTGHLSLSGRSGSGHSPASSSAKEDKADDKDDPSQVDTIALGDPSDAPVPARRGDHVSPVHPTILVHLPRFGEQTGLIPNTPAGHLLYAWLAAFNHASASELAQAIPTAAPLPTVAVQLELRQQTGGFSLLSAKEVQPGVLVFRLRDQTPLANEVLGTLQLIPGSTPASIASFSLRAVPSPRPPVTP